MKNSTFAKSPRISPWLVSSQKPHQGPPPGGYFFRGEADDDNCCCFIEYPCMHAINENAVLVLLLCALHCSIFRLCWSFLMRFSGIEQRNLKMQLQGLSNTQMHLSVVRSLGDSVILRVRVCKLWSVTCTWSCGDIQLQMCRGCRCISPLDQVHAGPRLMQTKILILKSSISTCSHACGPIA